MFRPQALETTKPQLYIPKNTTNVSGFSPKVLEWLYSYYVYDELISNFQIAYCPPVRWFDESIILPIAFDDDGNVLEYQRRFFPKAFFSTSGVKDCVFIAGEGEKLIIVEDYISAIRVGEHTSCLCLFGTNLLPNVLRYIVSNFTNASVWLDNDINPDGKNPGRVASQKIYQQLKKEYTIQAKLKPMLYQNDINISQIKTNLSAKEYSPNEIKNIISDNVPVVSSMER